MFCLSCGKKIAENSQFCKFCGSSQIETDSDNKESNPKTKKPFYRNTLQRAWFYVWITTLLVFFATLYISSNYSEKNVAFFANDYLIGLFIFNIIIGIFAFLIMFIVGFKKKNKPSFFTKKILIICLIYFLINSSIFAFEGYKDSLVIPKPQITPTTSISATPVPTKKVVNNTIKSGNKSADADPIIDCKSTYPSCNGSSIRVKQSQCKNITCCQIGNTWSLYPSTEKCKEEQKKHEPSSSNSGTTPTSSYKSPTVAPNPAKNYAAPTVYTAPTTYIVPTQQPAPTINQAKIDAENAARIDSCKSSCIRSVDEYITSVRVSCRASGGWSSTCENVINSRNSLILDCQSRCY